MFKFSRLICALCVCCCVGFAYGKAIKIKSIEPLAATEEAANGGDGMAIFNYHAGNNQTEATVAITDFMPGETYGAEAVPGGGVNLPEVANEAGNVNWHGFYTFDLCLFNDSGITVIIWRDADGDLLRNTDGTEDVAEGFAPCP